MSNVPNSSDINSLVNSIESLSTIVVNIVNNMEKTISKVKAVENLKATQQTMGKINSIVISYVSNLQIIIDNLTNIKSKFNDNSIKL